MSTRPPALGRLTALVERLRSADGCPWDRAQTWSDVRPYLLEEAHEVADALDRKDWQGLEEELGDLLFQLCFLAQLAAENGWFDMADIVDGIHDKMVARHPHVFDTETPKALTADQVTQAWELRKLDAAKKRNESLLDGVPASLPALVAAYRLSQKAAGVGFDWSQPAAVLDKVEEELAELRAALDAASAMQKAENETVSVSTTDDITEELGDLLFALASLSRHLGLDPERALALANLKFRRRFGVIETQLAEQLVEKPSPDLRQQMEALWNQAKQGES